METLSSDFDSKDSDPNVPEVVEPPVIHGNKIKSFSQTNPPSRTSLEEARVMNMLETFGRSTEPMLQTMPSLVPRLKNKIQNNSCSFVDSDDERINKYYDRVPVRLEFNDQKMKEMAKNNCRTQLVMALTELSVE